MSTQTSTINITITENGSRRVVSGLNDIGSAALGAGSALELLKHVLGTLALEEFIRRTIEVADAYTNLQNQIRQVTSSTAELNVVTDHLVEIAADTRTALESTASLYRRLARVSQEFGLSQNDLLGLTKSISQAVILSGASAQEASSGIIQLGHAMSLGKLSGRELRSVLEELPGVAQVIADSLHIGIGQLRTMAHEGKITSETIIDAFKKAKDELDEKFSHTLVTVGQAVQVLETRWESYIGKLNASTGVTQVIGGALIFLANNLDTVARALGAVLIVVFTLSKVGLPGLISEVKTLFALIIANPWTALLTAIVAATAALITFGDLIDVQEGQYITMRDVWVAVWQDIKRAVLIAYNFAAETFEKWIGAGETLFNSLNDDSVSFPRAVARDLDRIIVLFREMSTVVNLLMLTLFTYIGAYVDDFFDRLTHGWVKATDNAVKKADDFAAALKSAFATVATNMEGKKGPFETGLDTLIEQAQLITNARIERQAMEDDARRDAEKHLNDRPTATKTNDDPKFDKMIAHLKAEGDLLKLNRVAREQANVALQFEQKLKRELTPQEFQLVAAIVGENDALKQRSDVLEGLQANSSDFLEKQVAINKVMMEAPALTKALTEELAKLEIQMLQAQSGGSMVDGYVRQLRIMQLETRNAVADIGASFASIFGPGGSLSKGLGDAIAHAIVFKENFAQAMKQVAQTVVTDVISSLIQLGINMALNAALGNSLAVAAGAASVAEAAAVTAAWGPAATLVNAATFGAGSAAGTAALTSSLATIKALSAAGGFSAGGYTGDMGKGSVAGVVHGQEYVLNAATTRRLGRSNLDAMNRGGSAGPAINITAINQNVPGMQMDVVHTSPTDVRIIARQVVREEAGAVIANEISNPSSKASRSLSTHTTAGRRR